MPNAEEDRSHQLLSLKMLPENLIELRKELAFHADISEYAAEGNTFEECLAMIATKLDIALDGDYDVDQLSGVLVLALRGRRFGHPSSYTNRQLGLVSAELVERAGEVTLEQSMPTVQGQADTIVTEIDTSMPKAPELSEKEFVEWKHKDGELCPHKNCCVCYPLHTELDVSDCADIPDES